MAKSKVAGSGGKKRSTFLDGFKENFESIRRAALQGDLVLMQCGDLLTNKPAAVVGAMWRSEDGMYNMVPFARMLEGDPYEQLSGPGETLEKEESGLLYREKPPVTLESCIEAVREARAQVESLAIDQDFSDGLTAVLEGLVSRR